MALFRPSGGLIYHCLALRSRARWRPLVDSLKPLLSGWQPSGKTLILIGPSGGYTLPNEWLREFHEIHAFDLDPLASWFFKRHQKGVSVCFHKQDMFWKDGTLSLAPLQRVLSTYPSSPILFCNILGQLPLEGDVTEPEFRAFLEALRGFLEGRAWASYHDTFSHQADGTVIDHLTSGPWNSGLSRQRLEWRLRKNNIHELVLVTH